MEKWEAVELKTDREELGGGVYLEDTEGMRGSQTGASGRRRDKKNTPEKLGG